MDEFLQQMLGLVQLSNQQRAMRSAEARQRADMMVVFQDLKQHTTNPQLAAGLDRMFAPLTGRTEEELAAYSELLTPNLVTQQAASSQAGYDAMGSPERAVIDQASTFSVRTGQSQHQIGLGQDYLALPQTERDTAAGVAAGTRLNAGQLQQGVQFVQDLNERIRSSDLNRDVSWATNRLGWGTLISNGALQMLGLTIDPDKAGSTPQSVKFTDVLDLLATYGTALNNFQSRKGAMSQDELQGQLNILRGMEKLLIDYGAIPGGAPAPGQTGGGPNSQVPIGPRVPGDVSLPSGIPFLDYFRGRRQ